MMLSSVQSVSQCVLQRFLTVSLAQLERLQAHVLDHSLARAQRARDPLCQTRRLHVCRGAWKPLEILVGFGLEMGESGSLSLSGVVMETASATTTLLDIYKGRSIYTIKNTYF